MDNSMEEPIYQYYQIENDTTSNLIDIRDDTLHLPDTSEDDNQVFFLTFTGDGEDTTNQTLLQVDETIQEPGDDTSSTLSGNIKLITLDDGRVFMTTTAKDENFDVIEPHLITNSKEEEEELVNTVSFSNDEESIDDSVEPNFQLVELEDGTQTILQLYKLENDATVEESDSSKKQKRFHCEYEGCQKAYATSYHLAVHMRSHLDCKPYACDIKGCNKKFTTNYSLKAHSRTHTGEKPYGCLVCPKHFKTSGDLLKHVRVHTGEKPFLCPIEGCGKRFTTSNIRKVHIRSHTGERPFSCKFPDCGKAFTSSTNYKNHVRIHSGEKPYVCQVEGCDKRFTEYSSLYKHNAVHQLVRPFVCVFCGQRFKQEYAMNVHKRIKHNVVVSKAGTEIFVNFE